jgi:2,4-dichlorophenol 6-monooxygenase
VIQDQTKSHVVKDHVPAPVAIVGAGVAGSVLALLLAKRGIRTLLVEREIKTDPHPRGNVWSVRSMETLRAISPDLADELREASSAPLKLRYITWCTSLAGVDLGRCVPIGDPAYTADLLACSPCRPLHLSQNVADPIIRDRVLGNPLIEYLPGHELDALAQDAERCGITLTDCRTGKKMQRSALYVIGADGAASATRHLIGMKSACSPMQSVAQIHFRARLEHLTSARPSPLYWIFNPKVVGALTAHTADDSEWVLTTAVLPAVEAVAEITHDKALAMVHAAIGEPSVPIELMSVRPWTMELRKAESVRSGRALLIGDAAAGFSAIGGFGVNHGIQDAASLAWRLELLIKSGDAKKVRDALLDSYSKERSQSADAHARRTRELSELSNEVLRATGLDPAGFDKLATLSGSILMRALPQAFVKKLFSRLMAGGLKFLVKLSEVSGEGDARRASVRRAIEKQREVFVTLGTDLGHALSVGFVCPEQHPHPRSVNEHTEYWPTTSPGSLIPHLWSDQNGLDISTRDIARQEPLSLLAQASEQRLWLRALSAINDIWGIRVACPVMDDSDEADFRIAPAALAQALEIEEGGAVLVRGDGVVVWRTRRRCANPAEAITEVFSRLLSSNQSRAVVHTASIQKEMQ